MKLLVYFLVVAIPTVILGARVIRKDILEKRIEERHELADQQRTEVLDTLHALRKDIQEGRAVFTSHTD